jgi:deoxyadenosine/deoxycytidine kinase
MKCPNEEMLDLDGWYIPSSAFHSTMLFNDVGKYFTLISERIKILQKTFTNYRQVIWSAFVEHVTKNHEQPGHCIFLSCIPGTLVIQ